MAPNRYKDSKPIVKVLRLLYAQGNLNEAESRIMAESRPTEELYNLEKDPYELHNLADDPAHADRLTELRQSLLDWIKWSGDRGQQPEPEEMYDSDMAVYMNSRHPDQAQVLKANIQQMKLWAAQEK